MNKELLKTLLKTSSPSGYEKEATEVFNKYCSEFAKYEFTDKMGNSCWRIGRGESKKIMISAHIDEIGMQVLYITDKGMIHFIPLGGIDVKTLLGSEVTIHGKAGKISGVIGKKPIHCESYDERESTKIKIEDLIIDIGCETKEEVLDLLEIGSPITFSCQPLMEFGKNKVVSKGLDDKIGIFIVMEVLEKLSKLDPLALDGVAIYGVSNTQEEVGLRGAKVTSKRINPDISIDIDVTFATDEGRGIQPEKYGEVELGKGTIIQNGSDKSERLVRLMIDTAKEKNIPYQVISSRCGGTNTEAIQEGAFDCETALISIPNRNMHTQVEICDWRDIEASIDLITETIVKLSDSGNP